LAAQFVQRTAGYLTNKTTFKLQINVSEIFGFTGSKIFHIFCPTLKGLPHFVISVLFTYPVIFNSCWQWWQFVWLPFHAAYQFTTQSVLKDKTNQPK
jgi:hypothetical protein